MRPLGAVLGGNYVLTNSQKRIVRIEARYELQRCGGHPNRVLDSRLPVYNSKSIALLGFQKEVVTMQSGHSLWSWY